MRKSTRAAKCPQKPANKKQKVEELEVKTTCKRETEELSVHSDSDESKKETNFKLIRRGKHERDELEEEEADDTDIDWAGT